MVQVASQASHEEQAGSGSLKATSGTCALPSIASCSLRVPPQNASSPNVSKRKICFPATIAACPAATFGSPDVRTWRKGDDGEAYNASFCSKDGRRGHAFLVFVWTGSRQMV